MTVIVLSGYARAGKDTVADILVQDHGYKKVAYADRLRECTYALNPIVAFKHDGPTFLQSVIDVYGWEGYKKSEYSDEIRRLIQRLGTEVGRNLISENVWVNATLASIEGQENVVISDGRFDNEVQPVRYRGGVSWGVTRDGVVALNNHSSENGVSESLIDYTLENNGTIEDLRQNVANMLQLSQRGSD